jgi:hypothetical protein
METIEYEQIDKKLLSAIPELRRRYDDEAEWRTKVGGHPGQYDVICFVLKPFLTQLLDSSIHADTALLKRIFIFLEDMARSSDI